MSQNISMTQGDIPFSENFKATLARAQSLAAQRSAPEVSIEHLLAALIDDPDAAGVIRKAGADPARLRGRINEHLGAAPPASTAQGDARIALGETLKALFSYAAATARQSGRSAIDGAILLAVIVAEGRSDAAEILRQEGVTLKTISAGPQPDEGEEAASELEASDDVVAVPEVGETPPAGPTPEIAIDPFGDLPAPEVGSPPEPPPVSSDRIGAAPRPRTPQGVGAAPGSRTSLDVGAASEAPLRRRSIGGTGFGASRPGPIGFPAIPAPAAPVPDRDQAVDAEFPPEFAEPEKSAGPGTRIGRLVENIPRRMRMAVPEIVEARVAARDSDELYTGLAGSGEVQKHEIQVTESMTVQLRAPLGGFSIENVSPETQWIDNRLGLASGVNFAAWRWTVIPTSRGRRRLQLVISARMSDGQGTTAASPLPDQVIDVDVKINYGKALKKVAGWAGAAIGGGALARYGATTFDWLANLL